MRPAALRGMANSGADLEEMARTGERLALEDEARATGLGRAEQQAAGDPGTARSARAEADADR